MQGGESGSSITQKVRTTVEQPSEPAAPAGRATIVSDERDTRSTSKEMSEQGLAIDEGSSITQRVRTTVEQPSELAPPAGRATIVSDERDTRSTSEERGRTWRADQNQTHRDHIAPYEAKQHKHKVEVESDNDEDDTRSRSLLIRMPTMNTQRQLIRKSKVVRCYWYAQYDDGCVISRYSWGKPWLERCGCLLLTHR